MPEPSLEAVPPAPPEPAREIVEAFNIVANAAMAAPLTWQQHAAVQQAFQVLARELGIPLDGS